ncbi:translation elongation factor EF-1 alpha/Tu, putative [Ixodes scapularis]|uniref:Translation elongation factor EF-1 alpha/Tu, putative n=1 Tax=Ixodes scapularis TaxID=6945 RepID=B7QCK3_IXOSC|nr:translation elongation factor EF-1 alpha/Tu, putative [Ixodes scapularis]|eukprot:XP_002413267.1 translation elongation factor EF-1 alpha/Tu, putative [Ixodes scapularis]
MSRHRNVRTMNYDDGKIFCISSGVRAELIFRRSTSAEEEFLYNREKLHSMSSFLSPGVLKEENEDEEEAEGPPKGEEVGGLLGPESALSPVDEVRLYECLEKMQNVVGDSIPEATLRRAALEWDFNAETALDKLLSGAAIDCTVRGSERGTLASVEEPHPVATCGRFETGAMGKRSRIEVVSKTANVGPGADGSTPTSADVAPTSTDDFLESLLRGAGNVTKTPEAGSPAVGLPVGFDGLMSADIGPTSRSCNASSKDVLAEYTKERGGVKPLLNLVVIGHVDAGKSTLMGHLLYRLGCVQKKQMHKYEQDSKKLGKASFMYAWVLDETMEERNRGITMDVAQAKFETPARSIVLLDAPGHKDFIPNMITGAAQADVAILVVDATRGEFETGFEAGGQTREHTLLVRSLGVSQLAVAINKLDNVSWDEGRYRDITAKLQSFLRQAGYREADFTFVPCSGLTGVNLTEPPPKDEGLAKWYSGPCLVDVIDGFKPPERPVSKPFRLCVSDVFKGMGSGFCVSGRIDAGGISNGDRVLVMPVGEQGSVKGITIDDMPTPRAFAGDQVALTLSGVDITNVAVGSFLCDPSAPIRVGTRIQCRVVVFNVEMPLTRGFPLVLHYQSTSEQASVRRILSQLHKGTGEVVRHKPRCLTKNTSGIIELKVSRPVCVELYKEFKELGRITLRSGGCTVAAGVITEVT